MANLPDISEIELRAKLGQETGNKFRDLYNAMDLISSAEAAVINGVTAGAAAASKAVVLDASGEIDTIGFSGKPTTSSGVGAIVADKATVVEYGEGLVHQTVLTLTLTGDDDLDLADGDHGTGIKIYDFPAGRILVLGVTIDGSVAYTGTTGNFYLAAGTVVGADDNDLTSTEADLIPKTTIDGSAESPEDFKATLVASAHFDGTTTAKDLYINVACPNASNDDVQTYAVTGTLTVTWINLGDY